VLGFIKPIPTRKVLPHQPTAGDLVPAQILAMLFKNKSMDVHLSVTLIHLTSVQAAASNSRFEFRHQVAR
jgi:hypothetical protein